MEKILKVIRSRYFISAFVILLQFAQLLTIFALLNHYSIIMSILGYIFYIGVFLYIINKYESPEFKLPWVIIIMLFFVMGAFIFIVISGNEESKKKGAIYKKNKKDLRPYLPSSEVLKSLENTDRDAYLQVNYIEKTTALPAHKDTKVDYYKIGEEFHTELLKSLEKAEKFIFMEYFIIEEGAMWNPIHKILKEKAEKGLDIYVIYDDFGCMMTLSEKYYAKLESEGIHAIPSNKFSPIMSRIHNNRDHRKITVIDGSIGFTGGINIADEYINEKVKHGHWKDTGVKLEGDAVKSLTALFIMMWNTQNKVKLDIQKYMKTEPNRLKDSSIIVPYSDGPEEFYPDNVGKYVYLNMLSSAKKYVYITTPYLICDYEILNAICISAKKGVDVRIIVPHIPDKKTVFLMTKSNYKVLMDSGVKIYEYTPGFIHAKNFICDDKFATCGTINLDYRSLVHHFECGIWMYKAACIKNMKKDFLSTLEESELMTEKRAKLKGPQKLLAEVMKVFSPLL